MYDTIQIVFAKIEPDVAATVGRPIDHLGWYTDDLDATFERLSANSVSFPIPPREFGQVRLAFAEDPCGIWVELVEPPDGIIAKSVA
jgi:catechol 2,3-dioxygenase-like lactoylglutathione lyase family enzyme